MVLVIYYASAIAIGVILSIVIEAVSDKRRTRSMKSKHTISHEHIMECIGFQYDVKAKD